MVIVFVQPRQRHKEKSRPRGWNHAFLMHRDTSTEIIACHCEWVIKELKF